MAEFANIFVRKNPFHWPTAFTKCVFPITTWLMPLFTNSGGVRIALCIRALIMNHYLVMLYVELLSFMLVLSMNGTTCFSTPVSNSPFFFFFISYTNWFIPLAEEHSPGNWLVGKVIVSKLHVNSSYALYLQTSADLKTWIYSWFALDDQVGGFAFGSSCEFCPAIMSSRWKIYSFEFLLQITCCA